MRVIGDRITPPGAPAAKAAPKPSGGFLGNLGASIKTAAPAVTHAAKSAATPHIHVAPPVTKPLARLMVPAFVTHQAPHGTKLGGGPGYLNVAAISHPGVPIAHLMAAPAGILGRLGKEVIHLPASTLEGAIGLSGAVAHDVTHGGAAKDLLDPFGVGYGRLLLGGGNTALQGAVHGAVAHDPVVEAIKQGSLKPLAQNPLGTIIDATGLYGAIGKGAGALARAGIAKDAAALGGRTSKLAAPGIEGTAIARGYSPNLVTKALQVAKDNAEPKLLPQKAQAALAEHRLRLQVAAGHAAAQGEHGAETAAIIKTMRAAKPAGKEEAAVAPLVAMTGQNRVGLERILNDTLREPTPRNPDTAASRERMVADLQAMVAKDNAGKFDWHSVNRAAAAYKPLQDLVETQKAVHGLRGVDEMARALDTRRALLEPDVHPLPAPVPDPRLLQVVKDRAAEAKLQRANVKTAAREQAANAKAHAVAGAHITSTIKSTPVSYVTDNLVNKLLDEQQLVKASKAEALPAHAERVKFYGGKLKDAMKAHKQAVADVKARPLRGTVIEDQAMPQLTKGPLKGLRVRPLTAEDVAGLRSRDPALQSFVTARNPERESAQPIRAALNVKSGDQIIPMAQRGRQAFTGESLKAGDIRTGWSLMPNSLLRDAAGIHEARETQAFLKRFSLPTEHGLPHPDMAEAKHAAQSYEQRTGIKVSTLVDDNGILHNVPTAAVRELNRQRALDRPSAFGKLLTTPNRIFRKTVLPYSPKLPIMHNVENTTRVIAMEKGNIPRIVRDYKLGRAILNESDPGARARLQTLATPGSMTRTGTAGEAEDVGKLVTKGRSLPKAAVHGVAATLDGIATNIIRGQRVLEKGAQTVALGAHGRQMLQEWGHSWGEANVDMRHYAGKLADQLATPADAERAARSIHTALGKYNAFTANSRLALRVMPFASWYINAARLVMVTLPKDHPLFDALLQDEHQAMQKQWAATHQGLPTDLQDALPVGNSTKGILHFPGPLDKVLDPFHPTIYHGKSYLDIGRLTPIGLPNQSPAVTAQQLVLPQLSGAGLALAGKDPFMGDLKGPTTGFGQSASPEGIQSPTSGEKNQAVLSAIEQLVEGMGGPTNDVARAVYGKGGVLYNTSTPDLHLLTAGLVGHVNVKPPSHGRVTKPKSGNPLGGFSGGSSNPMGGFNG
ncbi:MAG: hypothetical protein ACXWPJ_08990 [Candidatus Limnocylindrales bacterium]